MNLHVLMPLLALAVFAVPLAAGTPPTLLELAGARARPARLRDSVVLIIDAQRDYTSGPLQLTGIGAALRETRQLLTRARAAGVPVVHIQQLSPAERRVFVRGTAGAEFAPEATPLAGEIVISKPRPDSFDGTALADTLQRLGRRDLIVSGYMTHMCVSTTVRSALAHGYRVTLVRDACATRDLPDGAGGVVPAATVHRVALAELADRFAALVETTAALAD